MKTMVIGSESDLSKAADLIIGYLPAHQVVTFQGEMGVGKTTLIKKLCFRLGVKDAMSSPTFSIVNEYRDAQDNAIYHFDFFRIKSLREAIDIGADEYFYSGNLCFIEWPEMINELLPENHLQINIKLVENNARELSIVAND